MEQSDRTTAMDRLTRTAPEGRPPRPTYRTPAPEDATAVTLARLYYGAVPFGVRQKLEWPRFRVRALAAAMRELRELRNADAPEAEALRFVGTLGQYVALLWRTPVRCAVALKRDETRVDGDEDVAVLAVEEARASGDRTALANALDALILLDCRAAAIYQERVTASQREKAALFPAEG